MMFRRLAFSPVLGAASPALGAAAPAMRRAVFSAAALWGASLLLLPQGAAAQATFEGSASASVGAEVSADASFSIGTPTPASPEDVAAAQTPPPPPAQPTVHAPPGSTVVIVPGQPTPPPPPPVVIVEPVRPAPPPVVVGPPPPVRAPKRQPRQRNAGLHLEWGGAGGDNTEMAGGAIGFRFRPNMGAFALTIGPGLYAGRDYYERDRVEVPVTADMNFYVNPRSRFQFYFTAGGGISWAEAGVYNDWTGEFEDERDFFYVGARGGAGFEFRVAPWFAVNADVRGFIRRNMADDGAAEFVNSAGESTNTSAGVLVSGGANFYF